MKKLILMLLLVVGGVMSASAENITIYFNPSTNTNWTSDNARFALALYKDGSLTGWVSFSYDNSKNCYYAVVDKDANNQFILCRMNGSTTENNWGNKWTQTPGTGFGELPTVDSYLYLADTNWDATYNVSLLPWGYYFYGNLNGDNWAVGDKLEESNGTYTGVLSGKEGKQFIIFNGEHINYYTGYIWNNDSWANAIRPNQMKTLGFENHINEVTATGGSDNWTVNYDNITFSISTGESTTWSAIPYFERTLNAAAEGYATFSSEYSVAVPEGLTASYASAVENGKITWTSVNAIAAHQGALLKGTAGETYKFTPATTTPEGVNNMMKEISTKQPLSSPADKTYYILSKVSDKLGFYKVNSAGSWVAAGTAYLEVPTTTATARDFYLFDDDETTNINAVKESQINGQAYNLAGQRVAQPTKGLYIVNGKKVIMK